MTMRAIAGFAIVLLAATTALADGEFVTVSGTVHVTAQDGKSIKASKGMKVAAGARIKSDKKGSAELRLADGSILKIRSNTEMRLSGNKRQKKKSSILLFFGRVWSKVAGGPDRHFEVKTANAVCGVRGTEFETAVADDGTVRVRVGEGKVNVGDEGDATDVTAGQEVEADETDVGDSMNAEEKAKWDAWQKRKAKRLKKDTRGVVGGIKGKIMQRKAKLEALRKEQEALEGKRKAAERRLSSGDMSAVKEIRGYNQRLANIADEIADVGDLAESAFEMIDHFADLANDPRFRGIDRKYLEAEAASLRRVRATLDAMVKEGTDISIEAMDKMLDDMSKGKPGSLRDGKGSSADDLFGDDPMKMR